MHKAYKVFAGIFFFFLCVFAATKTALAWDISTLTYEKSFATADINPEDVFFKPDGLKMFVMARFSNAIKQYTLTTPWDVATASLASGSFVADGQDGTPDGMWFSPDGTMLFISGQNTKSIYKYSLSTAWDVSTATYTSQSKSVSSTFVFPIALFFTDDGSKMFVAGVNGTGVVAGYSLSTPWDITTATQQSTFAIGTDQTDAVSFQPDGMKMFVLSFSPRMLRQYSLSTPWDVSTATNDGVDQSVNEDSTPYSMFIGNNGFNLYVGGYATGNIFQYSMTGQVPSPTPSPSPSTQSVSSSSPTMPNAPVCSDWKPKAPDLFQINTTGHSAKLFFAPMSEVNQYYISYATNNSAEQFGTQVSLGTDGVQTYEIDALVPNTTYYFKVRGQHACMPGDWSSIVKARTGRNGKIKQFYK